MNGQFERRPDLTMEGRGHDREASSIAEVSELVSRNSAGDVALPARWTIDRDLVPPDIRGKLEARTAAGLPNPIHAHGASDIAAFDERELRRIIAENNPRSVDPRDSPLQWALTDRQASKLCHELPFDGPDPTQKSQRGAVDKALLWIRPFNTGLGPTVQVRWEPVIGSALMSLTTFTFLGVWPGITVALLLVLAMGAAEMRSWRSLELTNRDFLALEQASVAAAGPDLGSREHRLAQVAVSLSDTIRAYPAWRSEFLALHRAQLNPAAEAVQVIEHATRISEIRAALGPAPVGDTEAAQRARHQRTRDDQILDQVLASLVERVAALYRYATELHALNAEYEALRGFERSLSVNPDLTELVRQTGTDAMATDTLNRLAQDAEDLRAAIEVQLQVLDGDLNALDAFNARS